ncbi:hypothetical protein CBER1_11959 [Cercospora berteroae]|uniref:Uncharacterized protein n=1 Tax=Cercospora berteroae TaxID=357750 RepID=A0A2S6CIL2_9PEZI|nr:hypothetical protein CBER1_11959 [Cercospora berteroae]
MCDNLITIKPGLPLMSIPTPDIKQRALAIHKAMAELKRLQLERLIRNALNTRNGPNSLAVKKLLPGDKVLVWRESGQWTGPYLLNRIKDEDCTVELPSGPTRFRITSVKPYLSDDNDTEANNSEHD